MSKLNVDTIEPEGASTTLTLGADGDTVDVPSGATLDVSSATMTGFTIPSGQTLTVASGGTITNSGTATGFGEDNAPSFSAIPSGDQSIANATWVKGAFATEQWDVGDNYDDSLYRFVAPADGKYMFRWGFTFSGFSSTSNQMETFLYLNGSGMYRGGGGQSWGGSDHNPARTTGIALDLSTDDYVEVFVVQNTGSSEDLDGDRCFFQGFVLAGV